MDRSQKIKLLKGLQDGTINISDIKPKELCQRIGYGPDRFTINGKLIDEETFKLESTRQTLLHGPSQLVVTFGDYTPVFD